MWRPELTTSSPFTITKSIPVTSPIVVRTRCLALGIVVHVLSTVLGVVLVLAALLSSLWKSRSTRPLPACGPRPQFEHVRSRRHEYRSPPPSKA